MKRYRLLAWLVVLAGVMALPAVASAFSAVSMQPNYERYVVRGTEPLVVVFDQSLDTGTVGPNALRVTNLHTGDAVAGDVTLSDTNQANDTLTFTPTGGKFVFGRRLQVAVDEALRDLGANPFTGELPTQGVFVANIPNNFEILDPNEFAFSSSVALYGFNPNDPENTNPADYKHIPGMAVTEAWKISTGRPDTLIVILDSGMEGFTDERVADNQFLNQGELPQPKIGDVPCDDWDCNGDGRFNARDYENDPDAYDANTNGWFDPGDLFLLFEDGADNDGNGFVDDISGWDFFRNANKPLGVDSFPEGTHGSGQARDAVALADNGQGDRPGTCPDCSFMVVRVGDAVLTEMNLLAAGIDYASLMGADVISIGNGTVNYSEETQQAAIDAYEAGAFILAASGDELGFHHIYPAAGEDVYSLKAILPIPPIEIFGPIDLSLLAFVESYCTNYGAAVQLSFSSDQCTSTATANAAGIAGLIVSHARDVGLDLTPGEVRELLNMTADDIKNACFAFNLEGCKPGWDQSFGYGRADVEAALVAIGDPLFGLPERLPPDVRITSPIWWDTIDPLQTPTFEVRGEINARGRPYEYAVEIGFGVEPDDADFVVVAEGNGAAPFSGLLATVDAMSLTDEAWLTREAEKSNDFTVTVRVRAWWEAGKQNVVGEARKAMAWRSDTDPTTGLLPGFPIDLGASGESSVVLYDLDGDLDGALEIIFGTTHSTVEAYKLDSETGLYDVAPGFPVDLPQDRDWPDSVMASAAVGPLFGDGVPYIVVATWYGRVYAIHPDGNNHAGGPFVEGFPVAAAERDPATPESFGHGNSFLASPVLADLDLDGLLEIIAAGADQYAYAWRPVDEDEDGLADLLPGWPVPVNSSEEANVVDHDKICEPDGPGQVIGTPVVGILDPDHENPDISGHPAVIVPTTETCNEGLLPTTRVYAIYWNGLENDDGPFLPDWPAQPLAPLGDSMPIPPLTIGSTSSPAAIRYQGQLLVGVGSFFWFPQMIYWDGETTAVRHLKSRFNLGASASGAFARYDGSDVPWYFFPTAGFLHGTADDYYLESFNITAWRLNEPTGTPEYLFHLDDINFFVNPVIADINGDALGEMLAGSGGYLIHAVNYRTKEPRGWPKFIHGWMTGSPAVADVNNDGLIEVVAHSHEGNLFAWRTKGPACTLDGANGDWPRFHHDAFNSGFYGLDAAPPAVTSDLRVVKTADPEVFEVRFTAPGDDWRCGAAALYELRFAADAGANLRDPDGWSAATVVTETIEPQFGGTEVVATVHAPNAAVFALRSFDDENFASPISNLATPEDAPPDDDTTDDDDDDDTSPPTPPADDDEGDDEDEGCGC
jgi:hypothetical protein